MENEKALEYLIEIQQLFLSSFEAWNSGDNDASLELNIAIEKKLRPLHVIAGKMDQYADARITQGSRGWRWRPIQTYVNELIGELEETERVSEIVGPSGPTISASNLHPTVWSASSRLWDDGHFRAAVQAAATQIEQELAAQLGISKSGSDLFLYAFGTDKRNPPADGAPRMRFKDPQVYSPQSENWNSQHEGAKFFGAGCMLGIRNLAVHDMTELDEQEALEKLAALSILARWVDKAILVTSGD